MLDPNKRAQMDVILGKSQGLSAERRAQMDAVLGKSSKPQNNFVQNLVKPIVDVGKDVVGSTIAGASAVGEIASRPFDPQNQNKFFDKGIQTGTQIMTPEFRNAVTGGEAGPVNAPVFGKGGIADVGTRRGATVASYITPLGKSAGLVGKLAKGAFSGAASGALSTYGAGGNLNETVKGGLTGGAFGAALPVAGQVLKQGQKVAGNMAERVATSGLGSPSKLKKVIGLTGKDNLVSFFEENNLWDRLPKNARDAVSQVDEAYKAVLASNADTQIPKQAVLAKFYDAIEKLRPFAGESQAIQNQIDELTQRAMAFQNKGSGFKAGLMDVYNSKKASASDLTNTQFAPTADVKGRSLGTKQAGAIFRDTLDKLAPGTKDLGRKESALLEIADVFDSYQGRGAGKQILNFTKLGSAGVGGLLAGVPGAIGGYILEAVANSPQGIRIMSKSLDSLSRAELNVLKQAISRAYQIGRGTLGSQMLEKPENKPIERPRPSTFKKNTQIKLPSYKALKY